MKKIFTLYLIVLLSQIAHSQPRFMPRNEVYKDSSLTDFVCKLQYAIYKRDKNFLLSVLHKNVWNSVSADFSGVDEFQKIWKLDRPNSDLWLYLSKMISLGGVFVDWDMDGNSTASFVFPYVADISLSSGDADYYETIFVTGENVSIREKPDKSAKIVGKLSYDALNVYVEKSFPETDRVRIAGLPEGEKEWYFVSTFDRKVTGYVYWDYCWRAVDYRMYLNKINGQWKIVCLTAGD